MTDNIGNFFLSIFLHLTVAFLIITSGSRAAKLFSDDLQNAVEVTIVPNAMRHHTEETRIEPLPQTVATQPEPELKKEVPDKTANPENKQEASVEKAAPPIQSPLPKTALSNEFASGFGIIKLSARQKFSFLSQIKGCYRVVSREDKIADPEQFSIRVWIAENGMVETNLDEVIDLAKYGSDQKYKLSADRIRRAIKICSPLRNFDIEKEKVSEQISLQFGDGVVAK